MRQIDAAQIEAVMDFDGLIGHLRQSLAADFQMPPRQVLPLDPDGNSGDTDALALLPAWNQRLIGCKLFTYFPGNASQGKERLYSKLIVFRRATGEPLALLDGTRLTYWRTAAVSALASSYLSNPTAKTLVLFGTGQLAPYMVRAHAHVRPIQSVYIVGRDSVKAQALADNLKTVLPELDISGVRPSAGLLGQADIISCATASSKPLFPGHWVNPGCLVDAIGNHQAGASEIDTDLVAETRLYVDSRINCLREAGEILLPMTQGHIGEEHIQGELADLCRHPQIAWQPSRINLFKAVGMAIADLAAADFVLDSLEMF
ncbi:bifunctional Delta(1)-pyrroline-2-carboxylate/Delta(1)-piperideine-2-carboxylate reductase [Bowmanella dokdonensis]|uniref:Ornithine cyclodeaminase family protein n=1 Tax=Bowmanella dokdonensis TaxID=751969 RepID=A0A939DNV2_9ALTE|nr:ornithine cyclodeaminase family protein [Bowmanella dokdonensis]MBN7825231.1 ornithine cyclodeaminase family protein [Bowmanella dokdonensis]